VFKLYKQKERMKLGRILLSSSISSFFTFENPISIDFEKPTQRTTTKILKKQHKTKKNAKNAL